MSDSFQSLISGYNESCHFQVTLRSKSLLIPEDEERMAGGDGDVLLAFYVEGDGVGTDRAAGLEVPEGLACGRVEGEEVALVR